MSAILAVFRGNLLHPPRGELLRIRRLAQPGLLRKPA